MQHTKHSEKAEALFVDGWNCAQSVLLAFEDLTGLKQDYAARLASSFGGGIGRLREICGAISGMSMVVGILYGYDTFDEEENLKETHYARVQELVKKFQEENGYIHCRDFLDDPSTDPKPSPRTGEYYATRPCTRLVVTATMILDEYIETHPIPEGRV